jgi:hypothetical protein
MLNQDFVVFKGTITIPAPAAVGVNGPLSLLSHFQGMKNSKIKNRFSFLIMEKVARLTLAQARSTLAPKASSLLHLRPINPVHQYVRLTPLLTFK